MRAYRKRPSNGVRYLLRRGAFWRWRIAPLVKLRRFSRLLRRGGTRRHLSAHGIVVAFSPTGDPATSVFEDAVMLSQAGEVDFTALSARPKTLIREPTVPACI